MHKQQIIFLHGATAFTDYADFIDFLRTRPIDDPLDQTEAKRWQSTLREQLRDTHDVYMPSMPNKQNAKYLEWKIWFERYHDFLQNEVILIGHSLGGYFLAKYLCENKMPVSVKALFLLAAPFQNEDFGGEDGGDFGFDPQGLPRLAAQAENIYVLHSKDDPIVPYRHAEQYKTALPQAVLVSFTDKNHFILEEFPELISCINQL